jgi:hypothetical protein
MAFSSQQNHCWEKHQEPKIQDPKKHQEPKIQDPNKLEIKNGSVAAALQYISHLGKITHLGNFGEEVVC